MGTRPVAQPAFEAGDYHDLLTELRANFLVEGEEEASVLLSTLAHGFELDRVQRIAHRWTGIAGILGFAEIAREARGIEDFLAQPGGRGQPGWARPMIAAGECVSRLRAELLGIRQMFSHAVRGRRETPELPPAVREILGNKKFAVIGILNARRRRASPARWGTHGAPARAFDDLPDNRTLQPFSGRGSERLSR